MSATGSTPDPTSTRDLAPTRDRIVREATRLFAEHGIKATTVARIEAAAGLRVGSGGVHRYFATKDDLVRAVLEAQLATGRDSVDTVTAWPKPTPDEVPAYLEAVGRLALAHSDASREVALIMLREAHNLPPGLLDEQHDRNFDLAYASTARALRELQSEIGDAAGIDPEALAFLFMAPIVYFRLIEWATGNKVLGLDDERLLAAWTALFDPVFRTLATARLAAPDAESNG